jgi:hypothetical protein
MKPYTGGDTDMTYDKTKAALKPGTAMARDQGCTCLFQPHHHYTHGITPGCPLHDYPQIVEQGQQPWHDEPHMNDDRPHEQF